MERTNSIQELRNKFIRELDRAENSTLRAQQMAEDLFNLDLTVYSSGFSFNSIVYNSFATSEIDENIAMHPEQIKIISVIKDNDASIISAPTSFGKTFCIFEYIVKYQPNNVVLIVPTLALVDEYFKKIIKKYKDKFKKYKVHTCISEDMTYDFKKNNIFILTHDKVVQEESFGMIQKIDFLVIDEVYKLKTNINNDRVLVLNMAYFHLAQKAEKYVLLAPFIKGIEDIEKLNKNPVFFKSDYSPVINDVHICQINLEKDRFAECKRILDRLPMDDKTLIYFPTVINMYNYIKNVIAKEPPVLQMNQSIVSFMEWARDEIHEDWGLIIALERGYLIHNGQIPIGTRMFQLDFYEKDEDYNRLLCTSTLLEGVNTTAKNIIITKPSRKSTRDDTFSAFDFYNLVGRTGRLFQHYIGDAYYIKGKEDPEYIKADAVKDIKFEITDESKDIDIQKGNIDAHQDVIDFLKVLNITKEEYLERIGSRLRFDTVLRLYSLYKCNKQRIEKELLELKNNEKRGRMYIVEILYTVCEGSEKKLEPNIINNLLNKSRPKIKQIVNNTKKYYTTVDIDYLIALTIRLKMSYIEHIFYTKVNVIRFFMEKDNVSGELLNILDDKILNPIEYLYFSNVKHKKMLLDLGIYERDVDKIIKIIGDSFEDAFELKQLLINNMNKFNKISYISRYIINNLV